MTGGVHQVLTLGPLQNVAFDDILKEECLPGVSIICYTNNTLVVITEDDNSHAQMGGNHHTWRDDLLDQVSQTEPSSYKDGSGVVYTTL